MKKKKMSMNSLDRLEELGDIDLCIFKKVANDFYKTCKECDGFNYNCDSYQTLKDREFQRKGFGVYVISKKKIKPKDI